MPLISVIMSVYNQGLFVGSAIDSILNQTFKNFEFIIINDGSTDSTNFILEQYIKKDNRLIVVNQKNKGLTASLNEAIRKSKGEYIAIQDGDDLSLESRLQLQTDFLRNSSECGLIGANWRYINYKGESIEVYEPFFANTNEQIKENIIYFNPFCHSSIMFRKEIINKVGLYNDSFLFAQDYEFLIRVSKFYRMFNLNEVLVLKRIHSDAISLKKKKIQKIYDIKAKLFAKKYLHLPFSYYFFILKFFFGDIILPCGLMDFYCKIRNKKKIKKN